MDRSSAAFPGSLVVFLILLGQTSALTGTYTVNDTGGYGRRFDGIGAISGGGATSKLLVNYPEQQRSEVLDFLFKPNYGTSLQIFKVEIGGDAQSSDGAEASHMHERWDENYTRGYEWWLMTEAKKRNPDILLYGLPWGFPAWIGEGTMSAYAKPEVTADYIIRWINGAKENYNLTIDIIGIWNERNYSTTYIKTLRKTLDARGLSHVRICAPDDLGWQIAEPIMADPDLASAVDFIGSHYPKTMSTPDAVKTSKPLWASEDHMGATDSDASGECRAHILNQNYVNGMMTATITWNLLVSYYPGLPFYGSGIMTASEPWSGHYEVTAPIWSTAHTTQFTKPGWIYLPHGSGVGKLVGGGSYVSLTDRDTQALTIVIETTVCSLDRENQDSEVSPQTAVFKIAGSFAYTKQLNVWYTKFGSNEGESIYFKQLSPIQVTSGEIRLSLGVNEVYTLTTLTSGHKGTAPESPPSQPFPLPYRDNFDDYQAGIEPYNLAQQIGVWETVTAEPPHNGIIRQVITSHPVFWCWYGPHPQSTTLNVVGNFSWTDVYTQIDFRIGAVNATNGVYVAARIDRGGCHSSLALGVFFFVYPKQQEFVLSNDLAGHEIAVVGRVSLNDDWNTLALLVQGDRAVGMVNGQTVVNTTLSAWSSHGFVGFGTDQYGLADFDNLEILSAEDGSTRIKPPETLFYRPQY